MTPARLRLLAYAGLYFFWGTTFLGTRIALQHGFPPFFMSGLRHGVAGLLMLAYARANGAAWPTRAQTLGATALGLLFLGICNGISAWAIQFVDSGYATLIMAGVPLVGFAYGALFQGQRMKNTDLGFLLLGLAGVGLLMSPKTAAAHASNFWGLAALLFAMTLWSLTMAEKRRFQQPKDPMMLTALQMLAGGIFLALVSAGLEKPWTLNLTAIPLAGWMAWIYLVIFGSCVGYASFSYLLDVDPPQRVGTYAYVNPLVAVMAGYLLLDEQISTAVLLSSVLIVVSVAGILSQKKP
jgi:drug/metabolite transporter (DMT)-like permease